MEKLEILKDEIMKAKTQYPDEHIVVSTRRDYVDLCLQKGWGVYRDLNICIDVKGIEHMDIYMCAGDCKVDTQYDVLGKNPERVYRVGELITLPSEDIEPNKYTLKEQEGIVCLDRSVYFPDNYSYTELKPDVKVEGFDDKEIAKSLYNEIKQGLDLENKGISQKAFVYEATDFLNFLLG